MTYAEAIDYLYAAAPLFQNVGAGAYKEGLANTLALDEHYGHPHRAYRTIHVAGTNGKGSVCHTLAAILQCQGLRVGLYTSPHLLDFRERIRVNGEPISQQRVVDFVVGEREVYEPLHPSFFELTTALAFLYFREQQVDVAVIEVGLGGRLDCTNIITPMLSVITNISLDHTQLLGHTLPQIAAEKAGIIKPGVPVVVGEASGVEDAFVKPGSPVIFAERADVDTARVSAQLTGLCQRHNTRTILAAVDALRQQGLAIDESSVRRGFANVCDLTGLRGRWQRVGDNPLVICDTGHNPAGLRLIGEQLRATPHQRLHVVLGMVGDKDARAALSFLPTEAVYHFTQPSVKRAMPAEELAAMGAELGLRGCTHPDVRQAYEAAMATDADMVFVGGSTFVVADFLSFAEPR